MYRNVLVGCDGSAHTLDAVALAKQLRAPDGRIALATVLPVAQAYGPTFPLSYTDWLRDRAGEYLDHAAAEVGAGIPLERQAIAHPSAAGGLHDLAERLHSEVIVLGPSHRGTLGELAGRKTVQRLLHGSPCAVAVAAPGQARRFGANARICVGYDGSPEARVALEAAYAIAAGTEAAVQLVHVLEPFAYASAFKVPDPDPDLERGRDDAAEQLLEEAAALAPEGVRVARSVVRNVAVHGILAEAGADADLVVAGSRAYGLVRRAIAGSVGAALLTHGHVPVLVTPRPS